MSKQKNLGKATLKGRFSPDLFLKSVLSDSSKWADVSEIQKVWLEDPSSLHSVVESKISSYESMNGGVEAYATYRQVGALLKKNVDWYAKSTSERRRAAYEKFRKSESLCRRTNRRLAFYSKHWSRGRLGEEIINRAALVCQEILGTLSDSVVEDIFDNCRHGSGLTFDGVEPEHRNLYHKLDRRGSITIEAFPYLERYALTSDSYGKSLIENGIPDLVRGNRVTFVPKTAQIDRTIAIEPAFNVFLQKGVDTYMRKLLSRVGIRLRDQDHNRRQARRGSVDTSLATIDLSSASDTVATELVRRLLPPEWFALLDDLRSHEYYEDGQWHSYAKFSSMGNAFTFPLESLVFYSLAKACAFYTRSDVREIRVYGDDIIVPKDMYALLCEGLSYAGFIPNPDKCYPTGHFRETCGHDYLQGINVRPVYLSRWPRTVSEIYSLYNRLLTLAIVPMPETLSYLRSLVSRPHVGPIYLSAGDKPWRPSSNIRYDSYLISDEPPDRRWNPDYQAHEYRTKVVSPIPRRLLVENHRACYMAFLLGVPSGEIKSSVSIPIRERWTTFTCWPSINEGLRLLWVDKFRWA